MESQTLIAVNNVEASSKWYQYLLSLKSGHGGNQYERLLSDNKLVLQLHAWEVEDDEHLFMGSRNIKPNGNGVVLWFQVDDFDASMNRVHELRAEILEEPHLNTNAQHMECWLRDLDGYVVVLASKPINIGN